MLPSRAYSAARPEITALWYSALTSILPSVAGVVTVLFHIVGVGASLQLRKFILDFRRGACCHRRGTGAQAHVSAGKASKDRRKWTPARQATMIHGIQLWVCSGRSSVRLGGFASFGGADVPSFSAALSGGRNDSLAAWSCSSSRFCLAAAPAHPAAIFFGSFAFFPLTLLTGLCAGSAGEAVSAGRSTGTACGLSSVCLISVIDDSRALMSKLTVLNCGKRCRQRC